MTGLQVSRQESGRSAQRNRTRTALVDAAARLLGAGVVPTVVEAAEEAGGISKSTAYRYFPTQESLLVEARLRAYTEPAISDAIADITDPVEAVSRLVRTISDWAYANEPGLRVLLHMSLLPDTDRATGAEPSFTRPAARLRYLHQALAPARIELSDDVRHRLLNALALLMGIDPVVTLTDVCRLPPEDAQQVLDWAARALTKAAINESEQTG